MQPFLELTDGQKRQYIDAEAVFTALEQAQAEALAVRGSMFWREQGGRRYLIRLAAGGGQKSLGPDTEENRLIHERFVQRKSAAESRVQSLRESLAEQVRLNRALRVGRTPAIVVDVLQALSQAGLAEHFITVGTHALYAYETACGVRVESAATATRDIDLLFDTQKRLSVFTRLQRVDSSLVAVLRKADKSFSVRSDQLQTVVNDKGFEVDIIQRTARDGDPHPLRMSDDEDDMWAVQVPTGDQLLSSSRFSQVVVATSGAMARMDTISPVAFARIKRELGARADRDPLKRSKDLLQAQIVSQLVSQYLPH
ncbi:GSU2403 family nucleotidyltransferase fold protein [Caenimonas koreensis]|uniref:Nucleotidyltransferase-like domain-containing protein n=1 Tax=Caenimonas koreensis DSM 17982 TaxID=1121255 RepID=A0A844AP82_9BURK|nr:GSU2403 family nucleotidyltransferase fold protein [Caenimonas koreensis]MRD45684.1 hypothetical protein [Caenimonas koreensis DSM 17982]